MDDMSVYPSIAESAMPAAPYTRRPPSPPFIHIPPTTQGAGQPMISMVPSLERVDSSQLTSQDVQIITRNSTNVAVDRAAEWSYEQRREAQPLLDFLYIGPNSVVRDHDFLRREGITMIVVARDNRMAPRLATVEKAAEALNIVAKYVDINDAQQMIGAFPAAIRLINDHLLSVYYQQVQQVQANGNQPFDNSSFRPGKVLITCETGNVRSAALAAAYMMYVFGKDMITTLQFICVQRFCCSFDEDVKRKLQSWEDLNTARSQVAAQAKAMSRPQVQQQSAKRQIDDFMDTEQNSFGSTDRDMSDRDRFEGREAFVPFVDMN